MEKTHLLNFKIILYFLLLSLLGKNNLNAQDIQEWQNKIILEEKINPQDSIKWEKGTLINLGFNRVGLYNWSAGGQNSMSIQSFINSFLKYRYKNTNWENQLTISFGILRSGYSNDIPWLKNDDRIELTSKFGKKTSTKWDYSALFNFRTQFTYGYNSAEELNEKNYFSSFLSPAFPLIALGLNYNGSENLSCFVSPATFKSTIVLDDSLSNVGVFGVKPGENIRMEAGGYMNLSYTQNDLFQIKDLNFKTNLTLFSNYIENPLNIDITWETLSSIKLRKLISLTFSTYLIYDDDIKLARYNKDGSAIYLLDDNGNPFTDDEGNPIQKKGAITQFKEAFSLGLMFKF